MKDRPFLIPHATIYIALIPLDMSHIVLNNTRYHLNRLISIWTKLRLESLFHDEEWDDASCRNITATDK